MYVTKDVRYISDLIEKLNVIKFNRPLEYNTGDSNNQILSFYELDNGNFTLNGREIIINGVWALVGDSHYNDILILEVENPKPYVIDGEECRAIAIINNEVIVSYDKVKSGYYRFPDGHVEDRNSLNIEERFIYDDTEKYIAIGVFHHCSIIPENDEYIDGLQKNEEMNDQIILKLKKQISKNKTYEVRLGL